MEGLTREEISEKYPDVLKSYYQRKEDYKVENGESLKVFNKRVVQGLEKIIHSNEGKSILIVSHGGVLDCLIRKVFNYPLSSSRCFSIYNTSINVFTVLDKKWSLEQWGIVDHLQKIGKLGEFN
jgi:probable phosphoglycerate mutase